MNINEFIKEIDKIIDVDEKKEYVKSHVLFDYVPFEKKMTVAQAIVDACFWKTDEANENIKELHVDSVGKYMVTCMSIFDVYTDIDRGKESENMLDCFNELNRRGVFDYLVEVMDQRELKEFNMVLDLVCQDVFTNEYENHAFISKQINRFATLVGNVILPMFKDVDIDQLRDLLKNYNFEG